MVEKVSTGGLMKFDYSSTKSGKLDEARRKDIERGYTEYYERKARERKNKIILWVVVGIVLAAILIGFLYWR